MSSFIINLIYIYIIYYISKFFFGLRVYNKSLLPWFQNVINKSTIPFQL